MSEGLWLLWTTHSCHDISKHLLALEQRVSLLCDKIYQRPHCELQSTSNVIKTEPKCPRMLDEDNYFELPQDQMTILLLAHRGLQTSRLRVPAAAQDAFFMFKTLQ
ncbi:hypothetical protein N7452_008122 [Penicillium brevicompactum]|uniref:Uncharacterized protein n=1 Tax=Penicillium brevicompactum TaxID=5074 RepID=A0A9W9Q5X0_PENBR|nr:hypothetical protein N7452_008122 [Penicillium brevicompactum]